MERKKIIEKFVLHSIKMEMKNSSIVRSTPSILHTTVTFFIGNNKERMMKKNRNTWKKI